jgi:hypothetical protein
MNAEAQDFGTFEGIAAIFEMEWMPWIPDLNQIRFTNIELRAESKQRKSVRLEPLPRYGSRCYLAPSWKVLWNRILWLQYKNSQEYALENLRGPEFYLTKYSL